MKKIITILILLFSVFLSNAQIISIDSLYYTYNDTIWNKHKHNYYVKKLWLSFNNGQQRLLDKSLFDKKNSPEFSRKYCPKISRYAFNELDSMVYCVTYYLEQLFLSKVPLDGSALNVWSLRMGTPEYNAWQEQFYIGISKEIYWYMSDNGIKIKDIDMSIDNNVMTLRCYKYEKQVVVFQYDFVKKEWAITEDRDLTEAEIDSLGFYKEDYDRAKIEETTKRNKRRKNKNK